MLYIVSTPIGNLEDISLRALHVLKNADYILCEDTRRSLILLLHYEIKKPLFSFHKFNEKREEAAILKDLKEGKKIALISDAGTPTLSDPGLYLVQKAIAEKIPYTAIPGSCSLIQALVLSGFDSTPFQFLGFLSKKASEIKRTVQQMLFFEGTSAAFVPPHQLLEALQTLQQIDPSCTVAVARELTKTFEECRRGTPAELLSHYDAHPPKGEIVLLTEKGRLQEEEIPLDELLKLLQKKFGLPLKEAIKMAAKILNKPKSEIYKKTIS